MKIRTVIADDEGPARNFLKLLLEGFEEVEIVGEAANGSEALEIITATKPDLALLDLQMPELSGLEVVRMLSGDQTPLVGFVTAFDEYAIRAFELNAVDYLLKPVEKERLRETIDRAKERIGSANRSEDEHARISRAADQISPPSGGLISRIPAKKGEDIHLIPVEDVVSIVANGELLNISTTSGENYLINFRLKDIESKLDSDKFIRLSRGAIANLEMFETVSPMPGGTYIVKLKDGQEISSSRKQSRIMRDAILKL